jgi:hypothetical protein
MGDYSSQAKTLIKEGTAFITSGSKIIEDKFAGATKASLKEWYIGAKKIRDEIKQFPVFSQPEQENLEKFDRKKLKPVYNKIVEYYREQNHEKSKSPAPAPAVPETKKVKTLAEATRLNDKWKKDNPPYLGENEDDYFFRTVNHAVQSEEGAKLYKKTSKPPLEAVEPIIAKKTPAYETEAIIMGGEDRNATGRRRPPPKKSKSKEPPTPSKLSAVSDIYEVRKKAQELLGNKYGGEEVPLDISTRKGKKYMLQVPNGRKKIHFGDLSSADYTKHKDEKRLRDFKKRNVKWKDYDTFTPAWLSYHLLW